MQKAMPAVHANQLGVEAGEILKINIASRSSAPRFQVWAPNLGRCLLLSCLRRGNSMGSYMVYSGYIGLQIRGPY